MENETAASLMQAAVTVAPDASLRQCARLLRDHDVRYLPVVDSAGRLLAMVTDEVVFELGGFVHDTWVPFETESSSLTAIALGDYASLEIQRGTPGSRVLELLAGPADSLVVVDSKGRVEGIITEHDGVRLGTLILPFDVRVDRDNTSTVPTANTNTPGRTLFDRMLAEQVRYIVIEREGQPVGVVSFRELIIAGIAWGRSLTAGELIEGREMHTAPEGTRLRFAAAQMAHLDVGCLPLVDSEGSVVSVVTRSDICMASSKTIYVPDPYAEWPTQRLSDVHAQNLSGDALALTARIERDVRV